MSFPRYSNYKESGVEWLGQVPAHWEVKPLKSIASFNNDVLPESFSTDAEIEYVDIGSPLPLWPRNDGVRVAVAFLHHRGAMACR